VNDETRLVAGRYRLDGQLGAGAMGVVWKAHDERLDRTVAIKELLMQPGLDEAQAHTARSRAMREGRIAARLQHPNAICVYDVTLDRGTTTRQMVPWLVMEYLPARSLATVLAEQGPLPPQEVARIGAQVAAALAAAHEAGIVHRDVKPGNVLLGPDGIVKITDFGISRASWDTTVTHTGVLSGTPAYFAPEVARGELPGPGSDVFSLGATLYAAVEGEPPFGLNDNTLAMLRTVGAGQVRPPQRAGPLSALLMRLLAKDPTERPAMSEAVTSLSAIAAPDAVSAAPTERIMAVRAAGTAQAPPTAVDLPGSHRVRGRIPWVPRPVLLFGAAACLLVLAMTLAVVSNAPVTTTGRGQPAAAPRLAAPAQPDQQQPAAPPLAPPPPTQLQPEQLEQTVRTYYGLLPQDTAAAWGYLGAAEHAKGFGRYANFWGHINRVSIRGPVAVQGNTVLVNLLFEPVNRKPTLERYQLNMGSSPDGRVLIESAARIGGFTLAAAQPDR
jgi:tRNA A-37 threonylcarbamoyl transferase component Bud32